MRYLPLIAVVWATTAPATEALLDDDVKITVAQSGFAGVTGTIYEVDTLANFTVSEFVNDQVTDETTDVLPPEALSSLQALLDQTLESSDANAPEINPMTITVNYQGHEWTVTMTPDAAAEGMHHGQAVRDLAAWMATHAESDAMD